MLFATNPEICQLYNKANHNVRLHSYTSVRQKVWSRGLSLNLHVQFSYYDTLLKSYMHSA